IAVIALARLIGDVADQGAADAADGCTDGRAADVAGDRAADDRTGRRADAGAFLRLRAAGDRQADQHERNGFLHQNLSRVERDTQAAAVARHLKPAAPACSVSNVTFANNKAENGEVYGFKVFFWL